MTAEAHRAATDAEHLRMLGALRQTIDLARHRLNDRLAQPERPSPLGRDSVATLVRALVQSTDLVIARERTLLQLDNQEADLDDDPSGDRDFIERRLDRLSARAVSEGLPARPDPQATA